MKGSAHLLVKIDTKTMKIDQVMIASQPASSMAVQKGWCWAEVFHIDGDSHHACVERMLDHFGQRLPGVFVPDPRQ